MPSAVYCMPSDRCLLQVRDAHRLEFESAKESMAALQHQNKDLSGEDLIAKPGVREYTVGRLKGLPRAVTEKGEPILCNIIPGRIERQFVEAVRKKDFDVRISELSHLIRNWVKTTTDLFRAGQEPPKCGRVKPLLALPMVGTGQAGGVLLTGLIADMMVELLPRLADEFAVDILLCLSTKNDYMLVQERRKSAMNSWSQLTESNKMRAETLAAFAKKRHLCFFVGAGMSTPAGLPRWGTLLELIDRDLGFPLSEKMGVKSIWDGIKIHRDRAKASGAVVEKDGKSVWAETGKPWDDFLEIAEELHKGAESTAEFKMVVAKHCDSPKHAIGHSLLACVPARSSITTNYDTLFEKACHSVDQFGAKPYGPEKLAVLPFAPKKECNRWLLKMHGCCTHPDDIVLTAEDYAKYESSGQAALGGLVQAELMTSHMMFVGFSMTDANFMRLITSVMDAYGGESRDGAGTIISVGKLGPGIKEVFSKFGINTEEIAANLEWNEYNSKNRWNTNPGREMEIFLDYLAMHGTDTAYPIFDDNFMTALKSGELSLRNHLDKMLVETPQDAMSAHAWGKVKALCEELGIKSIPDGRPPAGHLFVSMADVTTVAVDYWLIPCREIDASSVGLASQTMKKIWLGPWLRSGALEMPGDTLGDCTVEKLCWDAEVPRPPGIGPFEGYTVGRLTGLPDIVVEKGEPILCNIIPGSLERAEFEKTRCMDLDKRVEELAHLVTNWVLTAVEIFQKDGKPPKCGRVKPLLALPLIGTGGAGGVLLTGLIADMVVDLLPRLADQYGVDILLCLANQNDFMLVQQRRKARVCAWSRLTPENKDDAKQLAAHAKKNQICFFVGAGMSTPAGLPRWGTLLELIDRDLGFPLSEKMGVKSIWDGIKIHRDRAKASGAVVEKDGKSVWAETGKPWDDFLEIAEELHKGAESTAEFKMVVAKHCDSPKHAIGHSLLACVPARSSITTNYDTLFEKACHSVDQFGAKPYGPEKLAVLPFAPKKECNRWLLKMHGCCTHPDDIVLTAEDYAKYESSGQAALGGLVQAELMTSHMMFVGFSMTDANFMRLITSVMDAYGGESRDGAGTIISVGKLGPGIKENFKTFGIDTTAIAEDLEWNQYNAQDKFVTNPAREMEVFMDYLLLECTDTAYPIFCSKFETALTHNEKALRNHLMNFLNTLPQEVVTAPAWEKVKNLYKLLGSTSQRLQTDPQDICIRWLKVKDLVQYMSKLKDLEIKAQDRRRKRNNQAAAAVASAAKEVVGAEALISPKYLIATAAVNSAHDMSQMMPATVEEFAAVLTAGTQPCWTGATDNLSCTGQQEVLLGELINGFNNQAKTASERMLLVGQFMQDAAVTEQAPQLLPGQDTPFVCSQYKMLSTGEEDVVFFIEDYPQGDDAHKLSLALGVLRWCRFTSKLMDVAVQSFTNQAERDSVIPQNAAAAVSMPKPPDCVKVLVAGLSHSPEVVPDEKAKYLIATAAVNSAHDMSQMMPATVEEFTSALTAGTQPCWTGATDNLMSTRLQQKELRMLIHSFNNEASTPQARCLLVLQFMVECAEIESLMGLVTRYDLLQETAEKFCLVEDHPIGDEMHCKSLAIGVLRWCRFAESQPTIGRLHSQLIDLTVESWKSANDRESH